MSTTGRLLPLSTSTTRRGTASGADTASPDVGGSTWYVAAATGDSSSSAMVKRLANASAAFGGSPSPGTYTSTTGARLAALSVGVPPPSSGCAFTRLGIASPSIGSVRLSSARVVLRACDVVNDAACRRLAVGPIEELWGSRLH